MKKALLIFLLLSSIYSGAQENWLGKSRCDVNIAFQNAKAPRLNSNSLDGAVFTDTFLSGKNEETICNYDNMEICVEVIKIVKTSFMAGIISAFNTNYDKGTDGLLSTNVWFDKNRTFKVHLENWIGVNKFYLDYIPFDKGFVGR